MESNVMLPDLQSAVICEDVRCEVNGMQTLVGVDEQQVVAQAEVEFVLKEMEGHATNVHYFGGVQFQQYGMHHVEIYLENELRLRFPLPVIQVQQRPPG
jgi:Family of unknown function (DUF6941)